MEIEMFTTFGEDFNQEFFILSRWYFFKRVPYCHVQSNFFEVEIWIWKETVKTIIIIPFSSLFLWLFYGAHQKIRRPEISKCDSFPNPPQVLTGCKFQGGGFTTKSVKGGFKDVLLEHPETLGKIFTQFDGFTACCSDGKQQQKLRSWAMSTRSTMGIAVGLAGGALKVRTSRTSRS